jgi:cytosine/adenosine deaminase-related metal-dependent hydrolase
LTDPDDVSVTLIRGGHVLTMGPAGDLRDGAVAIANGEIVAVGSFEDLSSVHPRAEVVGDDRSVVIPGLVNGHTHLSEALIPGMGEDLTLQVWGDRIVGPAGRHLDREMAEIGTLLKAIEMIRTGVTTVSDMFVHTNMGSYASLGVVDGLRRAGLRGVVSFGAEDVWDPHPPESYVEEHEALAEHAAGAPLIDFRLGIGTVLGQTDTLLARSATLAAERGWRVHIHLAEVREEVVGGSLRFGETTVARAARLGLLDEAVVAHAIWLREPEVELLADRRVGVVHNPIANMILASGVCRVATLRRAGIPVGLGTDGAASNDSQDMLQTIKVTPLLQKVTHLDPTALSARDALRMATREGAQALGLTSIGSLEPGKRADVVRFRGDRPGLANVHDPYQQIVYCASSHDVADVWVEGRRILVEGNLTTIDERSVVEASRPLARELVRRAGLDRYSCLVSS